MASLEELRTVYCLDDLAEFHRALDVLEDLEDERREREAAQHGRA